MLCAEEVVTPLARTESSHAWKLAVWKGTGGKSIHFCGWLCGICVSKINVSQTCSCMQPALLWSHDPRLCLDFFYFLYSIHLRSIPWYKFMFGFKGWYHGTVARGVLTGLAKRYLDYDVPYL